MLRPTDRGTRNLLSWHLALTCLVVVCLVLTLANRFRHTPSAGVADVHSSTPHVKIQHREIDVSRWSAAVARSYPIEPAGFSHRVVLEAQPLLWFCLDGSRYDRPPPCPDVSESTL
jgi:hypothetical protein